ncbi:MAG: SAM-dependent methyltransferase [Verrucomicrobiae bacterium]|nr:SAM-dependent methyltransferase [Verrucomicrobiae bacterium]NNJ42137.1 SAM-dependent methyltransferase [Akkermansiaceae bacterium]
MSFDTDTRNRLASFVGKCRDLLCGDFNSPGGEMARQLANYGIQDTGDAFEVDTLTHLDEPGLETARTLRSILTHKSATAPAAKVWKKFDPAVYDLIQEQGFTVLNRLCALRMAEERKILEFPCISAGLQSDGFQLYEYHTGKANADISPEVRYQHFLFSLFDELSLDLGSLFDRFSPQGLLFPSTQALADLLEEINHPDLAHLWGEDETIGWIYQYWNSQEERKAMRDASAAPRNSRELAVRNQFFTPRYVVEFLTDNSLGRTWYEMTQGNTALKDNCTYLVRRPSEVFLEENEPAPVLEKPDTDLPQAEQLKQPVYIPFRPHKDPREIRLLDPACGSMHFGLYAFDLFETIYSEAWDLNVASLQEEFPTKEALLLQMPRLIIENNIHGVDIDPRATQIAGLALWLRAQRTWKNQKVSASDRPKVKSSNIVCAEPMPGDQEQLQEFTQQLHPAIAQMVTHIFEEMQLAGEAGSLLKIEEKITTLVDEAKDAWKKIGKHEGEMFSSAELVNADHRSGTQTQLDIGSWDLETLSAISDSEFFEQAEQSIYNELARYAESAGQGSYKRKLFANDAAQGFALIDLCRKRYEAVVMNPPFGDWSTKFKAQSRKDYPVSYNDIMGAFVERGGRLLNPGGRVGSITSRTCFFLSSFTKWREQIVLDLLTPEYLVDLGHGVMDAAMVEAAAYVLLKPQTPAKN